MYKKISKMRVQGRMYNANCEVHVARQVVCALISFSCSWFLPARRYASAGNSDRNVSVCHAPVLCQNEES